MSSRRILIVGGSTRTAADSVRRAGWQPVCADLFADLDLRRTAEVVSVRHYPDSLPDDVSHVQADGWFYCGSLENHAEILERMLATKGTYGPLLGTSPAALRFVRDPTWLWETCHSAGIAALPIAPMIAPPPADSQWLQKPLASAGGRSIRVWDETATSTPFAEPHYFQRRARGIGLSTLFRLYQGNAEWLGASCELNAPATSLAPSPFTYCGSYGPLDRIPLLDKEGALVEAKSLAEIRQTSISIMEIIAQKVDGLCGLIGLDFRFDGHEIWLTEVNPRYTASVEVLELATGRSLLDPASKREVDCVSGQGSWEPRLAATSTEKEKTSGSPLACEISSSNGQRSIVVMKQILYAASPMVAPDLSHFVGGDNPWQVPTVADIPLPGSRVESGWPVCTVLALGSDFQAVDSTMCDRVALIRDTLKTIDLR